MGNVEKVRLAVGVVLLSIGVVIDLAVNQFTVGYVVARVLVVALIVSGGTWAWYGFRKKPTRWDLATVLSAAFYFMAAVGQWTGSLRETGLS